MRCATDAVERERVAHRAAVRASSGLHDRLLERYGIGIEALAEVSVDAPDVGSEEEAARAEEIRARIARLGDVNPGAMAEYEEVRSATQFLTHAAERPRATRSRTSARRSRS